MFLLLRMTYLERYFSRTAINLGTGILMTLVRRNDFKAGEHRFSIYANSPFSVYTALERS